MTRSTGRRRWWRSRALALLGFALCLTLPIGALGAIDAAFDGAVPSPLLRSAGQHVGRTVAHRPLRSAERVVDHSPARPSVAVPTPSAALAVTLAVLGLLALLATGDVRRDVGGVARPRGPPSSS